MIGCIFISVSLLVVLNMQVVRTGESGLWGRPTDLTRISASHYHDKYCKVKYICLQFGRTGHSHANVYYNLCTSVHT